MKTEKSFTDPPGAAVADGADSCGLEPPSACACGAGRSWPRRISRVAGLTLPGVMLALIPKCPACLGAYVALGTGVGLSFGTAQYLRWFLLGGCLTAMAYFAVRTWREWSRRRWMLEPVRRRH